MSDLIGNVPVPEHTTSGTFPLVPDFPFGRAHEPHVIVHQFGSANAKIEQRFYEGDGQTKFTLVFNGLTKAEFDSLQTFWLNHQGSFGQFLFNAPDDDNATTTSYTVRFEDEPLSFEHLVGDLTSVGVTLVGVPTTSPSYSITSTATRMPSGGDQTALLSQVQRLIPLIKIQPTKAGYPAIYLSDRRCTVGGQLYQARLKEFNNITQGMNGAADEATFTFGNSDRVMTALANDVNLEFASVEFSLFIVSTGTKLDLWKGELTDWHFDAGPEFSITASDGLFELNLPYPTRLISRQCFKEFNNGTSCPWSTASGLGISTSCDKGYETPNGCRSHAMDAFFGGIVAKPQGVYLKQLGAPTLGNVFRRSVSYITSVSAVSDTIYGKALRDIYTDSAMEVNCDIAAGREESEFYVALGIVGRGPLTSYGPADSHTLDTQINHHASGPRMSYGHDPAQNGDPSGDSDKFSLGQGNPTTYGVEKAGGVAFIEIRRTDEKGQQLSRLADHAMKATVTGGLSGFIWSGPGSRTTGVLTNPVWIVVNMLINARGLEHSSASEQESVFDVDAAVASAAICDTVVTKLIGDGTEIQFKYRGVIEEQKPLKDWIGEVLNNCLGYTVNSFGKLKIGIRVNSSAVEAFTLGNVLFNSLAANPLKPAFNHLTARFADEDFKYQENTVDVYDLDQAKRKGRGNPVFYKSQINLSGTFSKSAAARIISTRMREELGGTTEDEQAKARQISFKTTVLALATECGQVCSLTHPDMPGGAGEFRIVGWRLNKDFSIDIQGNTTTDSMYDLAIGPKPEDVIPSAVPVEYFPSPEAMVWHPNKEFPASGDPLYGTDQGTFGLTQEYDTMREGSKQATLIITGESTVNKFPDGVGPVTIGSLVEVAGGSIAPGTYYLALLGKRADGRFTLPSNVVSIQIGSTESIKLDNLVWPAGTWTEWYLFASKDHDQMLCFQQSGSGEPSSVTWTGPLKRSTWSMPNPNFQRVRVKGKRIWHDGVDGVEISGVGIGTITCVQIATFPDNWTGRTVSVIADASDGSAALWNFSVTAYNSTTGTFTVTPDPLSAGLEPGDVLIIRTQPTGHGPLYVEDAKWQSGHYPEGMAPGGVNDLEVGRIVRIIAGKGAGQSRKVVGNTAIRHTIDREWDVEPDSTSVYIVESGGWEYQADSDALLTDKAGVQTEIRMSCDNIVGRAILVACVGVDVNGNESPEDQESAFRSIWMYGDANGVKVIDEDYTVQFGDHTLLVDTTAAPVAIQLLPGAVMFGLNVVIKLITNGSLDTTPGNDCTIYPAAGEDIDGASSVVLNQKGQSL